MKNRLVAFLLILMSLILTLALSSTAIFRNYENRSIDSRFYWRHRLRGPAPLPEIHIIGIDDQTLQALGGRWPIPLGWHALLLEALSVRLPAVVAYDILFQSTGDKELPNERKLVQATRMLGDVLYPYFFTFKETGSNARSIYKATRQLELEKPVLDRYRIANLKGYISSVPDAIEATLPLLALAENAALGFANSPGDEGDGVVRRVPLILRFENGLYPSFSLMAALRYYNVDCGKVRVVAGDCIEFNAPGGTKVSIPIDEQGRMIINYTARHNEFANTLFSQVVQSFALGKRGKESPVDLSEFEGKIVLVGLTASGVVEAYTIPTPLSPESPLLTIHANALSTIISGAFPHQFGFPATVVFLLLLGLVVSAITSSMKAASSLLLSAAFLVGYTLLAYSVFITRTFILPLVPGFSMALLVYTMITTYRYATEERQKKFYRSVLGKYLSRNVMEALLKNPSGLRLGGERKELTVLFADIRGFSAFCEKSRVEDIAPRLNEFHDCLTRIIWKHDGTLDKYMGDGLMAFWGAPLEQPDHARRAVLAAIEITDEIREICRKKQARGEECFSAGIGINSGNMIVGNMGSSDFWDYTVLGDEVNLGSRLEELTRSHRVEMLISEATYRLVSDIVEARRIGEVIVKGKKKPVVIYELIGQRNPRIGTD